MTIIIIHVDNSLRRLPFVCSGTSLKFNKALDGTFFASCFVKKKIREKENKDGEKEEKKKETGVVTCIIIIQHLNHYY